MDAVAIGLCIERNRIEKGWSISELAQIADLDVTVLQSYEKGTQKMRTDELKKISKALEVPLVALLHGGDTLRVRAKNEDGKTVCRVKKY